ncbi:adenylate cyclase [Edwardsiella ictaluri]|uniref:anthrax toxin-like adenylyl cyclase domain-containing protein n=2 Tax=Edwardsiella ictaluri TaxID=67780 RepID=UPI0018DC4C5E|nr:anthrax toxin-like adenylyl cyclase domain-containing protein [Edwardsiella ictaluri]QPW26560.1 adenylate cyclase [Edwardsiella ictaluri]
MKIGYNLSVVLPCQYSKEFAKNNDRISCDDEMQILINSIKDNTGIAHEHLLPLQRLANEINCIISFRPVDNLATELIESGYPTKGFHIKGKSASWGPQAGFICEEQRFSKLEDAPVECIDNFNQQVKQCISERHAFSVDLTINKKRLNTLFEKGVIDDISVENTNGVRTFKAQGPSGKYYFFEAKKILDSNEEDYLILNENKPIRVLAPEMSSKAFTADYDLFIASPHISDFGSQDNLLIPDVAHKVFQHRVNSYHKELTTNHELMQDYSNADSFYKNEDPDIGNASARVRILIDLINATLVGDGERLVHHSMDCINPATDLSLSYPATFALPIKIGRFDKLCIINNNDELKELINDARSSGYYIKINPLWEKELGKIDSQRFKDAKVKLDPLTKPS